MIYLNGLVSTLTVIGLVAVAAAWRHSLRRDIARPEFYFSLSKMLFALGIGLRLMLWDGVFGLGKYIHPLVRDAVTAAGGVSLNIIPSAIILCGVYCSLKSRQLLIPDDERKLYPWYVAWAHPDLLRFSGRR